MALARLLLCVLATLAVLLCHDACTARAQSSCIACSTPSVSSQQVWEREAAPQQQSQFLFEVLGAVPPSGDEQQTLYVFMSNNVGLYPLIFASYSDEWDVARPVWSIEKKDDVYLPTPFLADGTAVTILTPSLASQPALLTRIDLHTGETIGAVADVGFLLQTRFVSTGYRVYYCEVTLVGLNCTVAVSGRTGVQQWLSLEITLSYLATPTTCPLEYGAWYNCIYVDLSFSRALSHDPLTDLLVITAYNSSTFSCDHGPTCQYTVPPYVYAYSVSVSADGNNVSATPLLLVNYPRPMVGKLVAVADDGSSLLFESNATFFAPSNPQQPPVISFVAVGTDAVHFESPSVLWSSADFKYQPRIDSSGNIASNQAFGENGAYTSLVWNGFLSTHLLSLSYKTGATLWLNTITFEPPNPTFDLVYSYLNGPCNGMLPVLFGTNSNGPDSPSLILGLFDLQTGGLDSCSRLQRYPNGTAYYLNSALATSSGVVVLQNIVGNFNINPFAVTAQWLTQTPFAAINQTTPLSCGLGFLLL